MINIQHTLQLIIFIIYPTVLFHHRAASSDNSVLNSSDTVYNSTFKRPAPDTGGLSGDCVLNPEFHFRNSGSGSA